MQLDLSLYSISVSSLVLPSLGTHSTLLLLLSTLAYSMVQFLGYKNLGTWGLANSIPMFSESGVGMALPSTLFYSVAERSSFSFLDRVQMCVKPMAQLLLGRSRQLQDEMRKPERLKDFKEAPSVHDNMRALGT